jgi:hypothetical protein
MLSMSAMEPDPITEAARLAGLVAEFLQRKAASTPAGHERSELHFAEALARTLSDQLAAMRSGPNGASREQPMVGGTP